LIFLSLSPSLPRDEMTGLLFCRVLLLLVAVSGLAQPVGTGQGGEPGERGGELTSPGSVAHSRVAGTAGLDALVIDLDAHVLVCHSEKEQTAPTFKRSLH
jgi:hypothetical protein